jgi:O-antigen/teichoic acid export membrane protein
MAVSTEPSGAHGSRAPTAIRGGAIRVLGYAGGIVVSLGSATILVRSLGISGFGRYVTVISLVAVVGGVTEAGIVVYGIREFVARGDEERRRLLANLLAMRLGLTSVGLVAAVCFSLASGYQSTLVIGALIAGVGLVFQVIADVLSISLQAQLQLGRLAGIELSRRLLALILIGALALAGAGLLSFLAASTVSTIAALGLLAFAVRSYITIRLEFDWQIWRELFAETIPYAAALAVAVLYLYVTVIVMSLIASATQVGLFGTSFRVVLAILSIPSLLLTAIFPLMASNGGSIDGRGDAIAKVFSVALICGAWMSLAIAIGARVIIDLIAGAQGRGAIDVLRIQAAVVVLSFITTSSALRLVALRRYRPMLVTSACALLFNIALTLVLVPAIGARGGATADVVSEAVLATMMTGVLLRAVPEHQIRASLFVPVVFASALSTVVLVLPIGPIPRVVCATCLYFGALLALGAIPVEITTAIRRFRVPRTPGPEAQA